MHWFIYSSPSFQHKGKHLYCMRGVNCFHVCFHFGLSSCGPDKEGKRAGCGPQAIKCPRLVLCLFVFFSFFSSFSSICLIIASSPVLFPSLPSVSLFLSLSLHHSQTEQLLHITDSDLQAQTHFLSQIYQDIHLEGHQRNGHCIFYEQQEAKLLELIMFTREFFRQRQGRCLNHHVGLHKKVSRFKTTLNGLEWIDRL